ncbi:hypothetical protein EON79_02950 [bacterium]|nr:MAG: hypothetical protein EON79_02950 [bacterium]
MRSLVVTIALLSLVAGATGQDGFRGNRRGWPIQMTMAECLGDPEVQEALRLDLKQRLLLRNLRNSPPTGTPESTTRIVDLPRGFGASVRVLESMAASFRPDQRHRLRQLAVRRLGQMGPVQEEVAEELKLTPTQRKAMERLFENTRASMRLTSANPPPPPMKGASEIHRTRYWQAQRLWSETRYRRLIQLRRRSLDSMVAMLRPDQRARWAAMVGRPYVERFLHTSATLEAEMWRIAGHRAGDNPAMADARLRMYSKPELLALRRAAIRHAGTAALLFPEVAADLRLTPEVCEKVHDALWDATLTPGMPRPTPEKFLDAAQRKKWQALVAP